MRAFECVFEYLEGPHLRRDIALVHHFGDLDAQWIELYLGFQVLEGLTVAATTVFANIVWSGVGCFVVVVERDSFSLEQ